MVGQRDGGPKGQWAKGTVGPKGRWAKGTEGQRDGGPKGRLEMFFVTTTKTLISFVLTKKLFSELFTSKILNIVLCFSFQIRV